MKGKLVIGEFEDYDVYQAQVHSDIPLLDIQLA